MQPYRLGFSDPEVDHPQFTDHFSSLLSQHFPIEIVAPEEADYLLYSDLGLNNLNSQAIKIFFTGENREPDWTACDYALTHECDAGSRHFRLPYYALVSLNYSDEQWESLLRRDPWTASDLAEQKSRFCHFIYRNHVCKVRNRFFKNLSRYKRVDAAGSLFNNMENGVCAPRGFQNTLDFIAPYKFSISFENEAHRGYTTEKIFNALLARTVPIYWGNPDVVQEFNPESFINYYDFSSEKELLDYVVHVDENDDLYLKYLNAPILHDPRDMALIREGVLEFFGRIFSSPHRQRTESELRRYAIKKAVGRYAFARLKAWKRRYTKRNKR